MCHISYVCFLDADVYSLSCLMFKDQHVPSGKAGVTVETKCYFPFTNGNKHSQVLWSPVFIT